MQNIKNSKPAFTLVEVIIASTIFVIIGLITLNLFISILRSQARMALESELYEEARFLLIKLRRDIENNAIDYEEYFNKNIKNSKYGENYGCYAAQFYNPGKNTDGQPDKFGALCSLPREKKDNPAKNNPGCIIYKPSLDINTGINPFLGSLFLPENSSAMCNSNSNSNSIVQCSPNSKIYPKNELYLISPDGTKKTIYAKKLVNQNPQVHALSKIVLLGLDKEGDGITETWTNCNENNTFCCAPDFDCSLNNNKTLETTLTDISLINKGFIPVNSSKANITQLNFTIIPIEDPNKAFFEPEHQIDPKVILTIGLKPTESLAKTYGLSNREIPELTLQTTVNTKITTEIKSFLDTSTPTTCPLPSS